MQSSSLTNLLPFRPLVQQGRILTKQLIHRDHKQNVHLLLTRQHQPERQPKPGDQPLLHVAPQGPQALRSRDDHRAGGGRRLPRWVIEQLAIEN